MEDKIKQLLEEIEKEVERGNSIYPLFSSCHEGYAVLKEEVDELWDEVKKSKGVLANDEMIAEAIQVAAMAIKFIISLS